jgi:YggT family protein
LIVQAIAFVLDALFSLFILAALVRFWMQVFKAPVRNPIAQFTMALTDFAVKPLRRVIPGFFKVDVASLVVAWLLEFVLQVLLAMLVGANFLEAPGALSILLVLALVKLIRLSVYVFMGALIVGAVLSWVSPYHPVAPFFNALTNPFLKPFRRAIPLVGGVDITPVLVLIAFQLILMLPVTLLEQEVGRMLTRALL